MLVSTPSSLLFASSSIKKECFRTRYLAITGRMKTSSNSRSSTTKVSSSNSDNTILDDSGSSNEESIISSSNSLNTNIPDLESTDIPDPASPCVLQVLGVGGDEGKAVNRTIETGIQDVSFWSINTDAQALGTSLSKDKLDIG